LKPEARLGRGVKPPTDLKQFETWEASQGYGSVGYFGWCSISKRMAMYYMTGDEFSAREFVRLSFPDKQALKDIETIDGERIENKHDPLAGFYHYNAHMMILFWNLIETSPVFSENFAPTKSSISPTALLAAHTSCVLVSAS